MNIKLLLPALSILLSACAVTHPSIPQTYDPSQHARLRVGLDWIGVRIFLNQDCYDTSLKRAQETGFQARGFSQMKSRSIGMPKSENLENRGTYSEYVVPANVPIVISQRGGGTVYGTYVTVYTPPWHYPVVVEFEAGKDYEVWTYEHRPVVRELIVTEGKVTGIKVLDDLNRAAECYQPPKPPGPMPRSGQDAF